MRASRDIVPKGFHRPRLQATFAAVFFTFSLGGYFAIKPLVDEVSDLVTLSRTIFIGSGVFLIVLVGASLLFSRTPSRQRHIAPAFMIGLIAHLVATAWFAINAGSLILKSL
ncbi:MAG TPA: hypothetical protein DDZ88_06070 [Verrucomicrobiales bacterium]|nr:hypothetical protein [Verrucomicrobiales bacterium]